MPNAAPAPEVPTMTEISEIALVWLGLAVCGGVVLAVWKLIDQKPWRPLFPPQRQRAVPWGVPHAVMTLAVWLLLQLFFPSLFVGTFVPDSGLTESERTVRILWSNLAAFPWLVLAILLVPRQYAGAQYYQLGLVFTRPGKDLRLAYVFWLVVTPLVFGTFWITQYVQFLLGEPAKVDDITKLVQTRPGPIVLTVLALAVLIAAPVIEELLFRGVVQPALIGAPQAADTLMVLSLFWAIALGVTTKTVWWPALYLVVFGGGYLLFEWVMRRWLPRPGTARAIFAASLLFAGCHLGWPAPVVVAVFVLSLGLGFLAYRTQRLIGPIVMHMLFNSVQMGQVLLKQMAAP